jgi:hypothetical protein
MKRTLLGTFHESIHDSEVLIGKSGEFGIHEIENDRNFDDDRNGTKRGG